jgi:hypothetical protein
LTIYQAYVIIYYMSEKQTNPEGIQAFRGVYSDLIHLASSENVWPNNPVFISEQRGKAGYVTYGSDISTQRGEEFIPNGRVYGLRLKDPDGTPRQSWVILFDEDAAFKFGLLATIDIYEGDSSHPANIYKLYPDSRIKHLRRIDVGDMNDPEWREEVEDKGWLDTQDMEDLQRTLQTA